MPLAPLKPNREIKIEKVETFADRYWVYFRYKGNSYSILIYDFQNAEEKLAARIHDIDNLHEQANRIKTFVGKKLKLAV